MNDIIITIPGEPKGKGRPRFTKRGFTYTPKDTADYERKVRFCTQESLPIGYEPTDSYNIAKIILDSLNGLALLDDKHVTELYVYKAYDDNPRVVVRLSEASKESHQ